MIYLDCAATSLQKPRSVSVRMQEAMRSMASPGRGSHSAAMLAAETAFSCRTAAAELFHVPSPEQVVFTFNGTHGLNIAIHSLVSAGDRVVVSGYEHNSVMRPLHELGASVKVVRSKLFDWNEIIDGFVRQLPRAKAAVCTAMSNVFGYITPLGEISRLCRQYGVPLIVDASQLAGCGDINFTELGATFVAMPGHKGLLGPQGTGLLLCGMEPKPLLSGGTGSDSKSLGMPAYLPDIGEAGTHNIPGIAGLEAGIRWVKQQGVRRIAAHERGLVRYFEKCIREIDGVETFAAAESSMQGGVLSLRHENIDCERLCEALGRAGVAVRGGMHCAPYAHETVGTYESGTVRFSFSPFLTYADVQRAASILNDCVNKLKT